MAKFTIFAALLGEQCGSGQIFNIADQASPSSMSKQWPSTCAYIDIVGIWPKNESKGALLPGEYVQKHKDILDCNIRRKGEVFKGNFLDTYGIYLDFDRQFCLKKTRGLGFDLEVDPTESWMEVFDKFKLAGMIPTWKGYLLIWSKTDNHLTLETNTTTYSITGMNEVSLLQVVNYLLVDIIRLLAGRGAKEYTFRLRGFTIRLNQMRIDGNNQYMFLRAQTCVTK